MLAALGNAKDYTLKQYAKFAIRLQEKAKVSFGCDGSLSYILVSVLEIFWLFTTFSQYDITGIHTLECPKG